MDVGTWGTFRGTEGAAALPKTRHYKNISIDKKKWGADSQQRERELMLNRERKNMIDMECPHDGKTFFDYEA